MRDLTVEEIDQVGGGVNPLAIGAINSGAYVIATLSSGNTPTWGGAAGAFVAGSVGGGLNILGGALRGAASFARTAHSAAIGGITQGATTGIVTGTGGEGEASTLHRLEK